jgi:Concanavalin A-like lectin/glucanases superfamily
MLPGITPALFSGPAVSQGNDAFTKLLLHFDGANGSTTFVDVSPAVHGLGTANGPATVSTNTAKFGATSLLNSNNSWVSFPSSTDWDFGAGDFTVDWWEYRADGGDSHPIITRNGSPQVYQPFMFGYSSGGNCQCYASNDNASWNVLNALPLGPIAAGAWSHRAVVRKGTTFYGFKDGVLQGTQTNANAFPAGSAVLAIGLWYSSGSAPYFFYGYIDELRISKGIARWTANFTVPTKAYAPDPAATHFTVSAPATASVNSAFNVTVSALDANNFPVIGYAGTVHITSSNGTATLPANSTLTNGVGTFSVTLRTAGSFTVTATDTVNGSITGTSGGITASTGPATPQTIFLTGSGNWTVPADWTSNNSVEVIGGGGGGWAGGGGGGAYSKKSGLSLTPGQVIACTVGAGGAGAYWSGCYWTGSGSGGYTQFGTNNLCLAYGGGAGGSNSNPCNLGGNGGAGGNAGSGVGDTRYNGGAGGTDNNPSGGGGAGGPHGNGGNGGAVYSAPNSGGGGGGGGATAPGQTGGNNWQGYGGGASEGASGSAGGGGAGGRGYACSASNGGNGGNGIDWDASHGSGGGGGGGPGSWGATAGFGGLYGGGGGGGGPGSRQGAQGIIVIKYQ